jgi:tetratricopeptide (TPR) repeat protein
MRAERDERADNGGSEGLTVPFIWGSVPQRNKNFTGRDSLLSELRRRVMNHVTAVLPHALQGLGGVGKTQLAIEYAYRYQADYEVIWWIPADQPALVRSTLSALARRLGILETSATRVEDGVTAVLEALRRGEPYRRWLLVFDNADQPEEIRDLMPHGPGHVLVTSRNHRWQSMADTVEVTVFTREESRAFLERRVLGIDAGEANLLAEELGDLPLALEQAGALQAETGMSVDEYLQLLSDETSKLLAENQPADYTMPVAAAWSVSVARLTEQMPFAMDLLRRCAFFGPEPISRDLLSRGRFVLDSAFGAGLADPFQVSRAIRELGRYALARIDNNRRTLQVHRLIQKLIRDEMSPYEAEELRGEVHLLLAAADPDAPDDVEGWSKYQEELLPHITPSGVVESTDREARRLVGNVVRYLYIVGDSQACLALAEQAQQRWIGDSGPDSPDVLHIARRKADVLWALGRYPEAHDLRAAALSRARATLGPNHEETLNLINGHGADLRARGRFVEAREMDTECLSLHRAVFGEDHPNTFGSANNLAVDYELTSSYAEALELDERTYHERQQFYGRDDQPLVIFSLNSVARDIRQAGRYLEARDLAERAYAAYAGLVDRRILPANHQWVLLQAKDLSVARRMAGDLPGALALALDVYSRYQTAFSENHLDTLAAAINYGNALRRQDQLDPARDLVEETVQRYARVLGPEHPYTHACVLNLAIIRRQQGDAAGSTALLEDALAGLRRGLGEDHHYTLTCATSLCTALADRGQPGDAQRALALGEASLPRLRALLGADHPHTLMSAANLSIDLSRAGRGGEAATLFAETLSRYRRTLGSDHPDVLEVAEGVRVDFVFEPSPV